MIGETSTGFKFEIDDDVSDDYELLEALQRVAKGSVQDMALVIEMLLGEEQKDALKEHVRSTTGQKRVSTKCMLAEFHDIFNNAKVKNC